MSEPTHTPDPATPNGVPTAPEPAASEQVPLPRASRRQQLLGILVGLLVLMIPVAMVWYLVGGHTLYEVHVWDDPQQPATSVAFSPDGKYLAAGSNDSKVYVWNTRTGEKYRELKGHKGPVMGVAFSPDGDRLVSGGLDTARVWDLRSGEEVLRIDVTTNFVLCVAYSPDGKYIATASGAKHVRPLGEAADKDSKGEYEVQLWDAESGKLAKTFRGHTEPVRALAFSPDGTKLLTGGDTTAKLWDVETGEVLRALEGHSGLVLAAVFSPDGSLAATSGQDQTIRIWNVADGQKVNTISGHENPVTALAFSDDGLYLFSASLGEEPRPGQEGNPHLGEKRSIRGWHVATGAEWLHFETNNPTGIWGMAISPDGDYIATAGGDKKVRLWSVP